MSSSPISARTATVELLAPDGTRVRVQTFPRDPRLMHEVAVAWERLAPDRTDRETFRLDLQQVLRRWYPLLTIHPQDDLAALSNANAVWYVIRDGLVGRGTPWRDRAYGAMADARQTQESVTETLRRVRVTLETASRPRPPRGRRTPTQGSPGADAISLSG